MKWEYLIIKLCVAADKESLDIWGENKWELVAVSDNHRTLYFKRPLEEEKGAIGTADREVAQAAFEYSCNYCLAMSADEFLRCYDANDVDRNNTKVQRIIKLLPLVR